MTSRRTFLKGSAVGIGVLAAGVGSHPATRAVTPVAPAPRRYWYRCWGPGYLIGDYSSPEEVWAAPGYMEIREVEVHYTGARPHQLLPEERAAARAVERWSGRALPDPPGALMHALKLSTRTPLQGLPHSLGTAGGQVVRLAIELHPDAPQAGLLRAWLGS